MKFNKVSEGQYQLDVCGYVCPHPQLYTKKALEKIKDGEVIEILFDNPSSGESIAAMLDTTGDEVMEKTQGGGKFNWKVRKRRA
ncbi:MAG: sulfurtransferase TusA family protein [Pseudomonadota bacterium]|nr:MAG: sulfurtransferase TusA family protein [Pseudomonadota bacterium]